MCACGVRAVTCCVVWVGGEVGARSLCNASQSVCTRSNRQPRSLPAVTVSGTCWNSHRISDQLPTNSVTESHTLYPRYDPYLNPTTHELMARIGLCGLSDYSNPYDLRTFPVSKCTREQHQKNILQLGTVICTVRYGTVIRNKNIKCKQLKKGW
jgi:hypothetical protein